MHKPAKDKDFIKQPWYEGGPKAMKQFIAEQLRYPAEALAQKVEGTVTVRFDIDHKGDVVDAKTIGHALGFGCDEEAVRLVKTMRFKVEKPRGLRVIFHKTMQIHFRLPLSTTQPTAPINLAYSYTAPAPEKAAEPADKKPPSSFSYSLDIG